MPSPSLPLNSLDKLIAEHKLLRILSPDVSQQIKSHRRSPYVIEYDKQIYLSLEHILDDKQRQYYYQAIQRHQAGQNVDLMTLPHELQRILQPNLVPPTRFWEPLIIGGIVGLVIGVLAMAVGTLFLNVTAVTLETATLSDPFGLQKPIIIFVFFSALGWAMTSWIVWRRMKRASLRN